VPRGAGGGAAGVREYVQCAAYDGGAAGDRGVPVVGSGSGSGILTRSLEPGARSPISSPLFRPLVVVLVPEQRLPSTELRIPAFVVDSVVVRAGVPGRKTTDELDAAAGDVGARSLDATSNYQDSALATVGHINSSQ